MYLTDCWCKISHVALPAVWPYPTWQTVLIQNGILVRMGNGALHA